jgi:hypothetical protein
MIGFLRAHGMEPGPLQRPLLAGAVSGLVATVPAGAVFVAFGSFTVVADQVMQLSRGLTALLMVAAFALSGSLYGLLFRRAANDRAGGWLFGCAFGFLLWMAAPVVVLPLLGRQAMAAGLAATGFFACFLVWGAVAGAIFPHVHHPLHAKMDGGARMQKMAAAGGAVRPSKLLRRVPRGWR